MGDLGGREDKSETHLCKLCMLRILRSRKLRFRGEQNLKKKIMVC